NVHETVLRAKEIHEGAEIHHLDDLAIVNFADLRFRNDALDPFERGADRFSIGRSHFHGSVILDVDLGAGLLDDFADHLAARPDHFADLVGWNVDHLDARRVLAQLGARLRNRFG